MSFYRKGKGGINLGGFVKQPQKVFHRKGENPIVDIPIRSFKEKNLTLRK